jgi:Cupin
MPPHTHPYSEVVTVISGTIGSTHGEKFEKKGEMLKPGSLWVYPAKHAHYAWTGNEEAIAKQGGDNKDEAAGGPRETSVMLQKVFAALRAQVITRRTIAGVLQVYPKDVDELAFGLALSGLDGSATADSKLGRLSPRLKIVSSKE